MAAEALTSLATEGSSSSAMSQFQSGAQGASLIGDLIYGSQDRLISALNDYLSFKNMKQQQKKQYYLATHPYSVAVADLTRAGLNPVLAAGGGVGHTGSVSVSPATRGSPAPSHLSEKVAALSLAKTQSDMNRANTALALKRAEVEDQILSKTGAEADMANLELSIRKDIQGAIKEGKLADINSSVESAKRLRYDNAEAKANADIFKNLDNLNPVVDTLVKVLMRFMRR